MDNTVRIAVEGPTDAAVLKRLLLDAGFEPGPEYISWGKAIWIGGCLATTAPRSSHAGWF